MATVSSFLSQMNEGKRGHNRHRKERICPNVGNKYSLGNMSGWNMSWNISGEFVPGVNILHSVGLVIQARLAYVKLMEDKIGHIKLGLYLT